ncbi:A/G-specific adenine glycosylase [Alphaproteobacteria bacterium]|nr:A/G-specific adenine glycosylase [Alphaproteobacteria bacterium]
MEKQIISKLLRWYAANKRDLPWRLKKEDNLPLPYYVLVSEYMLQQTTVPTVKTRFEEFIKIWPTLKDLAKTTEPKILKFWSGLGYYSRARNLLKAAKIIDKNLKSEIPKKYEDLIILPGVGDYTAKAILGIGYNASVMPLDANIERILARLYALNQPLIKVKKKLSEKAQLFLSKKYSSNLIQSFMDYGSIICTPRNPNCSICEIKKYCLSYQKKIQNTIPVKVKKTTSKPKKFSRAYILINEKNEILVRKRASKGMLASMLEVPNDDWVEKKSLLQRDIIINEIPKKLIRKGDLRYSFSHFDLYVEIFYKKIRKIDYPKSKWLNINKYSNSQLPTVMKKILEIII